MSAVDFNALQQVIYGRLAGDATLNNMAGIYDYVPEDAAFPFIVINTANFRDISARLTPLTESLLDIHAFSRSEGKAEVQAILLRVYELLQDYPDVTNLKCTGGEVTLEGDGVTYHAQIRFRAVF